jgi:hypothetical protein
VPVPAGRGWRSAVAYRSGRAGSGRDPARIRATPFARTRGSARRLYAPQVTALRASRSVGVIPGAAELT